MADAAEKKEVIEGASEPIPGATSEARKAEPQRITYKQLAELMFSHFEKRDDLKADLLEAVSNEPDNVEKQRTKATELNALDEALARTLSSVQGVPVVDMFMAMMLAMESYRLLMGCGLRQAPMVMYTGAQAVEASIRAELEHEVGKRLHNMRLELLLNAADGKAEAQRQHAQGQSRIILASK
jgi:hypothetical protein